jgi:hypothetical protein
MRKPILNHTQRGELVYEPRLGPFGIPALRRQPLSQSLQQNLRLPQQSLHLRPHDPLQHVRAHIFRRAPLPSRPVYPARVVLAVATVVSILPAEIAAALRVRQPRKFRIQRGDGFRREHVKVSRSSGQLAEEQADAHVRIAVHLGLSGQVCKTSWNNPAARDGNRPRRLTARLERDSASSAVDARC